MLFWEIMKILFVIAALSQLIRLGTRDPIGSLLLALIIVVALFGDRLMNRSRRNTAAHF